MYSTVADFYHKSLKNAAFFLLISFAVGLLSLMPDAFAKTTIATGNPRYAALVVNADTGVVLHQENADKFRYPASLTKMMTLYLTFEAIKQNKLQMEQQMSISSFAASRPRMNMGFKTGQKISVHDAILSVVVRSANDSAVALAEQVSGTESAFAEKMNVRAKELGMLHTVFRNASGLPNPEQKTTAYDLARLAIALRRDFPEYYPLFSRTNFTYNGRVYQGHNRITSNYPGCDGLKTGFVNASGFNLVSSAKRGDTKVVAVVMGGPTAQSRDRQMVSLLDRFLGRDSTEELIPAVTVTNSPVHKASFVKVNKKQKKKIYKNQEAQNTVKAKRVKPKNYSAATKRHNQQVAGL